MRDARQPDNPTGTADRDLPTGTDRADTTDSSGKIDSPGKTNRTDTTDSSGKTNQTDTTDSSGKTNRTDTTDSSAEKGSGTNSSSPAVDMDLPSRLAQALTRRHREEREPPPGFQRASVLVVLRPDPEGWAVPLMLRTEAGGPHSGQISFPGGRAEPTDADALATALREASEEFGLEEDLVEVLGMLDDETTPTGYLVTPVVAWTTQASFRPDPAEVAEIFSVPLAFFQDPANEITHEPIQYEGRTYSLYEYRPQGRVIWGLTARIVHKLVEALEHATAGTQEQSTNDRSDDRSDTTPGTGLRVTNAQTPRQRTAHAGPRTTRSKPNEETMSESSRNENHQDEYQRIQEAAGAIRAALGPAFHKPRLGMILGSGLGAFAEKLEERREIPYGDIPHFPSSAVAGHAGKLVVGRLAGVALVVMQGRVHYYEGHDLTDVVRPARVLVALGAETLIVTNAAGSARKDLPPGELVLIRDHLNMLGHNPLRGPNDERLGPRFPDMSQAYDPELRALAAQVAQAQGWQAREGVYACMMGPSYETPAEVAMVGRLGGDLVGMSTVPEVIAARHMGARILGISCVTNYGSGLSDKPLSHDEVKETAARVTEKFESLLTGVIQALAKTP